MNNNETIVLSEESKAATFDKQRKKLEPIKDALHLCIQVILSKLPNNARVLCVGAGTGAELINLAKSYPQWTFTVVEPAKKMIDICRKQADKYGFASRCVFHEGYIDTLSNSRLFDVATSILVSHFIIDKKERIKYFCNISKFIKSEGYMINADLSTDILDTNYTELLNVWVNMHDYAGMSANIESFGRDVSILPIEEIESILVSGGFEKPVLFYQAFFIKAWFSRAS